MDAIRRGDRSSGMGLHIREAHPEVDTDRQDIIEMTILQHRPKNMERGIAEAILIEEMEQNRGSITTNRKAEWGRVAIRRLTTQDNTQENRA